MAHHQNQKKSTCAAAPPPLPLPLVTAVPSGVNMRACTAVMRAGGEGVGAVGEPPSLQCRRRSHRTWGHSTRDLGLLGSRRDNKAARSTVLMRNNAYRYSSTSDLS